MCPQNAMEFAKRWRLLYLKDLFMTKQVAEIWVAFAELYHVL